MHIAVAVGRLADEPPTWLRLGIAADDIKIIEAASGPRRRRELEWSRGLIASLEEYGPLIASDSCRNGYSPVKVSITHDCYFTAVAATQIGSIGVDLQSARPLESCNRIAQAWFPNKEAEEIFASKDCERFLQSWVIKESWAKCMNRSIFEACGAVGVWEGGVRFNCDISDCGESVTFRFAWVGPENNNKQSILSEPKGLEPRRVQFESAETGFMIGVCLTEYARSDVDIGSFIVDSKPGLFDFHMDWHRATAVN